MKKPSPFFPAEKRGRSIIHGGEGLIRGYSDLEKDLDDPLRNFAHSWSSTRFSRKQFAPTDAVDPG
jgi:hypothetical protein